MKNISFKYVILIASVLVAVGVFGRLLPHAWNATPVLAVSLFAGFLLGPRYALIVPVAVMFISDLFIGFYSIPIMLFVYASFVLIGLTGIILRRNEKFETFLAGGVVGATLFFLTTNGAVWLFGTMYPHTLSGLVTSYAMGLPFFKNMIIGDLFYVAVFFGAYKSVLYLVKNRVSLRTPSYLSRHFSLKGLKNLNEN